MWQAVFYFYRQKLSMRLWNEREGAKERGEFACNDIKAESSVAGWSRANVTSRADPSQTKNQKIRAANSPRIIHASLVTRK